MEQEIQKLTEKRKRWIEINKENDFQDGLNRLLTQLYPDNAHFIYELLQNAEDAEASYVAFKLSKNQLVLEHDGNIKFAYKHIESITSIGNSSKVDDPTQIGKFGVGFKAVFSYTATPIVNTGTIKFQISELVVPEIIEIGSSINKDLTEFTFPFNNPSKTNEIAFKEIQSSLNGLDSTSLLFLKNIFKITIEINGVLMKEIERKSEAINVIKIINNSGGNNSWLLFDKVVAIGNKNYRISIAFAYDEDKKQVMPVVKGKTCIYFPCDKETSNLKFHIHAPFASTVARDSVRDTEENKMLIEEIGNLAVASLKAIETQNLLNFEFFKVLPNSNDELNGYKIIRTKIHECFKNESLMPMQNGTYATTNGIFIGNNDVKKLFNDEDLAELLNSDDNNNFYSPMWVKGYQNNDRVDKFLSDLGIRRWGFEDFLLLCTKNNLSNILNKKKAAWHMQLYAALYNTRLVNLDDNYYHNTKFKRKDLNLIKLQNGKYEIGENCHFITKGFETSTDFKFIDREVYTAHSDNNFDKQEAANAKRFLEGLGARYVSYEDTIKVLLENKYRNEGNFNPDIRDIFKFVAYFKSDNYDVDIFNNADYFILQSINGKWMMGNQALVDEPFSNTGLNEFYNNLENKSLFGISDEYLNIEKLDKQGFIAFVKSIGAIDTLQIVNIGCEKNPNWNALKNTYYNEGLTKIDVNHSIVGLAKNLNKQPLTSSISKLIWNTLNNLDDKCFNAHYRPNQQAAIRSQDSTLVHLLLNNKWVAQVVDKNVFFSLPIDSEFELLPKDFIIIKDKSWLTKLKFGEAAKSLTEKITNSTDEIKGNEEKAKLAGFEHSADLKKAKELLEIQKQSGFSFEDFKAKFKPKNSVLPSFPSKPTTNPERLKQKSKEQFQEANKISFKSIIESVRLTANTIDPKSYLKGQYTNDTNKMVCQLCHDEMPFKTKKDNYYFEAVEIIKGEMLSVEFEAQFIALCPVCAARYKEYVKIDEQKMIKLKGDIIKSGNEGIPIQLDRHFVLKFTESHRISLRTALENKNL